MASVTDQARGLTRALRESDESRRMRELGSKVKTEPKLESLLSEIRRLQLEVQTVNMEGKKPSRDTTDRLKALGKTVESNRLLKDYLAAEESYFKLLVRVQEVLSEAFNPDVPGQARN